MGVILQGQTFIASDWGEALVSSGTATVTQQFAFAIALTGTLTQGAAVTAVEQNPSHTSLTLTCAGTGANNGFILVDGSGNDYLFANTTLSVGSQLPATTAGFASYDAPARNLAWTGAQNTDFANAENWDDTSNALNPAAAAPGGADTAQFLTGGGTITGSGMAAALQFGGSTSWDVTGAASLSADTSVTVGQGGSGTVLIDGGAHVNGLGAADMISGASGGAASVTVDGAGSTWKSVGELTVGDLGAGSLTVSNQATVSAAATALLPAVVLGAGASGNGSLSVTGAGSRATLVGQLIVGQAGTGSLTVENQGTVSTGDSMLAPSQGIDIAQSGGGAGGITVSGTRSLLTNTGEFIVGDGGVGGLAIESGGTVATSAGTVAGLAGLVIANTASSAGSSVNVSGSGSQLDVDGLLDVGAAGSGWLDLSGGATVAAGSLDAANVASAVGQVSLSGAGTTMIIANGATVADDGTGVLSVLSGATFTAASLTIGSQGDSSGALVVSGSGSVVDVSGALNIGTAIGTGDLTIGPGAAVHASVVNLQGQVVLENGLLDPVVLPINPGQTDGGFGTIAAGDIVDEGVIQAGGSKPSQKLLLVQGTVLGGGTLTVDGALPGSSPAGVLRINAGGTLELAGAVLNAPTTTFTDNQTQAGTYTVSNSVVDVTFADAAGVLELDDIAGFAGTIATYQAGDAFVITGGTLSGLNVSNGDTLTVADSGSGGIDRIIFGTAVNPAEFSIVNGNTIQALAAAIETTVPGFTSPSADIASAAPGVPIFSSSSTGVASTAPYSVTTSADLLPSIPIITASNPGPIGTDGGLLLVAGLADTTGPTLGGSETSDDTIAGRAIDTAAIVSLTVAVDNGAAVDETGAIGSGGGFTLTPAMLATIAGGTIADGQHSVVVSATDASNNTTQAGISFTLDSIAPTLTAGLMDLTGTTALAQTLGATSNDTVNGTGSDPSGIISLFGTLDGSAQYTNLTNDIGTGGAFTLTPSALNSLDGGTLPDGSHSLVLQATDVAGNVTTQTVNFLLQTTTPAPILNVAAADQTGTDQTDASQITLVGQSGPGDTVVLIATGATTVANTSGDFRFDNVPLSAGSNPLQVQATNLADISGSGTLTVQLVTASGGTDPVLLWDQLTLKAIATDADAPTVASRSLAMESLAVYDVIAGIDGTPGYLVNVTAPSGASADAAVAEAADQVLDNLYPGQTATFDAQLATSLSAIPGSLGKTEGIAFGQTVAQTIIALRANDGSQATVVDNGSNTVGLWAPTAPGFANAVTPQWANVTPFALTSSDQFLPPPPPAMDSSAYADAVNETESLGAGDSTTRTAAETQEALWWNDQTGTYTPAGEWNAIAASLAASQDDSMATDAQILAELNVAEADAGIAAWNSKYTYNAWRPITEIPIANETGNSAIIQDPTWTPLLTTPAFPEYVAGHAVFSQAAAEVLNSFFGDDTGFSATSPSLPGVTLDFTSFDEAAQQAGESRVWGGIHFQFSVDAGFTVGQEVGDWALNAFNLAQDTLPPTIVLNQTSGLVTNADPTITGDVTDNLSGVASLTVSVDGGAASGVTFDSDGSFSVPIDLALNGSADGTHTLEFFATDAAGNLSNPFDFNFTLDTVAPVISLADDSVQNDSTVAAGAVLDGTVTTEIGVALNALSYTIDGGTAIPLNFDPASGDFDQALALTALSAGVHTLTLSASDAAGNSTTQTLHVTLPALPPLTIASLTPLTDATNVGVTYRPEITFSRAVDPNTVTAGDFYATDSTGAVIPASIAMANDNTSAYLFFTNPMPGDQTITLHVDGSAIAAQADGALLDAAGTGTPGSDFTETFTTVSTAGVPNTTISGIVVDPGPDDTPMSPDDFKAAPDGSLDFANDTFKLPIAGVQVYVLGDEQNAVYTNAQGQFTLSNVPVGDVKVVINGTTATNPPAGYYFPTMTMDLPNVRAGVANTMMGSMGSPAEQTADAADPAVYLPRVASSILTPLSTTVPTVVTAVANSDFGSGQVSLTSQQLSELSLTVQPGSVLDANGDPMPNAEIGISPVPPAIVQDMLPPGLLQHTFDLTIQAPGGAVFNAGATLTTPNVFGLSPGEKTFVLGFDHTTGQLAIQGTATASADGLTVTTDPGSGVTAPGWHGMTSPGSQGQSGPTVGSVASASGASGGIFSKFGAAFVQACQSLLGLASTAASTVALVVGGSDPRVALFNGAALSGDVVGVGLDIKKFFDDTKKDPVLAGLDAAQVILEDGPKIMLDIVGLFPGEAGEIATKFRTLIGVIDAVQQDIPGLKSAINEAQTEQQQINNLGEGLVLSSSQLLGPAVPVGPSQGGLQDSALAALNKLQTDIATELPTVQQMGTDAAMISALQQQAQGQNIGSPDAGLTPAQAATYANTLQDFSTLAVTLNFAPSLPADLNTVENDVISDLDFIESEVYPGQSGTESPGGGDMPAGGDQIYPTFSASDPAAGSASGDAPIGQTLYAALASPDGTVQRFTFNPTTGISYFLAPDTLYTLTVFDPTTLQIGGTAFMSNGSGTTTTIPLIGLAPDTGTPGADGLTATAAYVIGVNPATASNLVPGITDLAAIQQGLVNGSVTPGTTGIVASVPLQGTAQAVVLAGSVTDVTTTYAYVATGFYGLAILDVTNPFAPVVLSQLALAGGATGVAVDQSLGIAVVADGGGGLRFVDVSNPTAPTLVQTVPINASSVLIQSDIAYVSSGTTISAVDVASGVVLQTINPGASITGLAVFGTTLYSMDTSNTLRVFDLSSGQMVQQGSVALPAGGNGLVADMGVVYVAAANGTTTGDYLTVDVSNPAAPVLIAGVANGGIAGGALALNGSGLGIAVQQIQEPPPTPGLHDVADLVNTSDTAQTGNLVTRFNLSAPPGGIAIGNGIGFIADGASGLQVLNYLAPDTTGEPPTIAISTPPIDVDPSTSGIQVYEGVPITVGVTVSSNVQVRNVELLVNGTVVTNDVSFPFNLSAAMPTIANNGTNAVTIQAEAIDTGGNTAFSTAIPLTLIPDTRPLTLVSESVTQGETISEYLRAISVSFSKPIDPASVTTSAFELIGPGAAVVSPSSIAVSASGQTVQLSYGLVAPGSYQFVVSAPAVTDFEGNTLGSSDLTTDFTVQQFTEVFANAAGGSWNTAGNWSGDAVPGTTDSVLVAPASGVTVSYDGGTNSAAELVVNGGGLFQLTAGQLSVDNLLQINGSVLAGNGTLIATGSVAVGAGGTLTVRDRGTALDNVAIAAGGAVAISDNDALVAGGLYANSGSVSINSIGNLTQLLIGGSTTLQGGGQIVLAPNFNGELTGLTSGATLINVDNVISGGGQLGAGQLNMINQAGGVIDGTQGMVVNTGTAPLSNFGTIEATNAGSILLGGSITNNAIIQSVGSGAVVGIQSGVIMGGTLTTSGGGTIAAVDRNGVLDGISATLTNLGTVVVRDNMALTLRGTIDNAATIAMASVGDLTQLLIGAAGATLQGGGTLALGGNVDNIVTGGTAGGTLTNVDDVITGGGQLGGGTITLINQANGVIDGTLGMVVNTGTVALNNLGTIEATNAGTIFLGGSIVNNATIQSVGSGAVVGIQSGVIMGGTLTASGGGTIASVDRNGVLDGTSAALTNTGTVVVRDNAALTLRGTIDNAATIALASVGDLTQLLIGAAGARLQGGGTLTLGGNVNNIVTGGTAGGTLTNVDNVITGGGQLGGGQLIMINQAAGVIDGTQGMVVNTGTVALNNLGTIEATNAGTIFLGGSIANNATIQSVGSGAVVGIQSGVISGGTLTTSGGGTIASVDRNGVLDGTSAIVTNLGTVAVRDNTSLTLRGTINNVATIAMTGFGDLTQLLIGGSATLQGGGTLTLGGNGNDILTGGTAGGTLTNADNVITGGGQLGGGTLTLINQAAGVIDGTQGMVVNTGTVALSNLGTIEASNAGTIFLGGSIANNATIQAVGSGAVVGIQSGVIMGGTFTTSGGGTIASADRNGVLDGTSAILTNLGTVAVRDNTSLTLRGTIDNVTTIEMTGLGDLTQLLIGGSATLEGGGTLALGGNVNDFVTGGTAGGTLTNVDNVITGGGKLGGGTLTLINQANGVIDGTQGMVVNTGTVALNNLGTIEASNAGTIFLGGSIANNATIQSVGSGAVVGIQSGIISGGTLTTSGGGTIASVDRNGVLDGTTAIVTNLGTVAVRDNTSLTLRGTIDNVTTIAMNGFGDLTQLLIGAAGATLQGGGTLALGANPNSFVTGVTAGATMTNVDNTIIGGSQLGGGALTLINQAAGVIDGTQGMVVNTGSVALVNQGTMEATAAGGLNATSTGGVTNTGLIWADGAPLSIAGNVSGTGAARITGATTLEFGGSVAAGQTISFDTGSTGTLRLDHSLQFSGTIAGLAANGSNALDLSDISFINTATTTATFSGGTLTVTDGTHIATLALAGNYNGQSFVTSSDGHSGTKVVDPPVSGGPGPVTGAVAPGSANSRFGDVWKSVMPDDLLPGFQSLRASTGPDLHSGAPVAGGLPVTTSDTPSLVPLKTGWLTG